ncbi:MAG: hypothetical protein FJ088_04850, partial [Deltaproteobacteria bacterium]|nr:hypothetical protein [Deltaproteobacteria bacterium]
PDAVKFHTAIKIALLVFILMFAYYNSRVSSFIKTLPSRLRERRSCIIGLLIIAAVYLADVVISLALKWEYLFMRRGGEVVEHLTPGAILLRIFLTAPDILLIYLVAIVFILNKLLAPGSRLGTRFRTEKIDGILKLSAVPDFLERHPVFLACLCLSALAFAAYHSFILNAQTSFHFSQKHILETYRKENGSQQENLYKHLFSSRGTEDVNFYTALIPEVNSREEVVRKLLLGERSFFIVPKNSFSDVNHSFRQKSGGRHIPVLDARSSRFILVSNDQGGQPEQNWLKEATTTKEAAEGLKDFKKSFVNFDDKIHLLGYTLDSDRVRRGGKTVIKFYFESQGGIGASYRLFMHIDHQKGGNRIHGDHWPVNLIKEGEEENNCSGCYATTHWLKGDVVIDTFAIEIPIGSPSGAYDIWMGFYNPSDEKRLKVKDFDKAAVKHDGQNRARAGVLIVD